MSTIPNKSFLVLLYGFQCSVTSHIIPCSRNHASVLAVGLKNQGEAGLILSSFLLFENSEDQVLCP